MGVPKQVKLSRDWRMWKTRISYVTSQNDLIRGYLEGDLIGRISYPDLVGLFLLGELPSKTLSEKINRLLVKYSDLNSDTTKLIKFCIQKKLPLSTILQCTVSTLSPPRQTDKIESLGFSRLGAHGLVLLSKLPAIIFYCINKGKVKKPGSDFIGYLWSNVGKGALDPVRRWVFESVIISYMDRGVSPASTQAARLAASYRVPMYPSIALGLCILGGRVHGGTTERFFEMMASGIRKGPPSTKTARETVRECIKKQGRVPGYGHPFHDRDPRPPLLWKIYKKSGLPERCVKFTKLIGDLLSKEKGIYPNLDAAVCSILLDLGVTPDISLGIFAFGRSPSIIANYIEQREIEPAMRRIISSRYVEYTGPKRRKQRVDRFGFLQRIGT